MTMFQQLRLKLTLINAIIMLTLFLLLIAGVYCFSRIEMARHANLMAGRIVRDIRDGVINDFPPQINHHGAPPDGPPAPPPPGRDFFFVKTSSDGAVTFRSSEQPLSENLLTELTAEALRQAEPQGKISHSQGQYSYWKSPLDSEPATIVLFHDLTPENNMMKTVLSALVGVGLICSLLSFGASFFLANRAMIPIQQAWQQQKDFLSDASHELRTPLTVFRTNLEVIMDSPEETVASQAKWLNNIREVSIDMAKLVDSLLFLAQADSQQQTLAKRLFSFNALLEQIVAPFEAVATAKGLSLEIVTNESVKGRGDEARIKQVIGILLDNAIRHTPAGGKISVSLSQVSTAARLTVADTGEGIEPDQLNHIFERFYQVDKSRNKGGAGLGLAIAKWIVENHGGNIWAASSPGAGATFTVNFPLA